MDDDEGLLAQAESALTEIKIAQGLSDEHASVLAALRIRLKGDAGASLEDLLASAGDLGGPGSGAASGGRDPRPKQSLDDAIAHPKPKGSLDDVLSQPEKPKPDWPG